MRNVLYEVNWQEHVQPGGWNPGAHILSLKMFEFFSHTVGVSSRADEEPCPSHGETRPQPQISLLQSQPHQQPAGQQFMENIWEETTRLIQSETCCVSHLRRCGHI